MMDVFLTQNGYLNLVFELLECDLKSFMDKGPKGGLPRLLVKVRAFAHTHTPRARVSVLFADLRIWCLETRYGTTLVD